MFANFASALPEDLFQDVGDPADRANMHWTYRTLANLRRLRRVATPGVIAASRWMIARGAERGNLGCHLSRSPGRPQLSHHPGARRYAVAPDYRETEQAGEDGFT